MMTRKTLIALCGIFLATGLLAVPSQGDTLLDENTLQIALNAPQREDYPDAKTVTLWGEKTIELLADGGWTVEWRVVTKVLTFMGKKEMSNIKYISDTDCEEIDITRARSITPAGDSTFNVVISDETEINDITPPGLSEAGIYASLQQRVVTIPGVDDSSIVDIGGTIRNIARPKKPFGGIEILASETPVHYYKLTIIVPEGQELKFVSANGAPEPIIEGNRYVWIVEDYEGIVPEPQGPRGRNVFPAVYYSATKNWTLAADYIQKHVAPKILLSESIQAKADEIIAGATGRQAIDTLTSWVARNIKFIDLDLGDAGYSPNSAAKILENGYGDTRDRAVLHAALLKAAGFDPKIALVSPRNVKIEVDVPAIAQFSRMILTIEDESAERLWLWTEDEYTPPGILPGFNGETALIVSQGKGQLVNVPEVEPSGNGFTLEFDIEIDDSGGMAGSMVATLRGNYARRMRDIFRDASPKRKKQRMENVVSNLAGGELRNDEAFTLGNIDDMSKSPTMSVEFETEDYAFIQDEMMIFNFPENPLDFAGTEISISLDERKEALVLSAPFVESYRFTVRVPTGYKIAWVSQPTSVVNDFGEIRVESSLDGNLVNYEMTLSVRKDWIKPVDYAEARDLLRAYMAPKNRLILLERVVLDEEVESKEGE